MAKFSCVVARYAVVAKNESCPALCYLAWFGLYQPYMTTANRKRTPACSVAGQGAIAPLQGAD